MLVLQSTEQVHANMTDLVHNIFSCDVCFVWLNKFVSYDYIVSTVLYVFLLQYFNHVYNLSPGHISCGLCQLFSQIHKYFELSLLAEKLFALWKVVASKAKQTDLINVNRFNGFSHIQ